MNAPATDRSATRVFAALVSLCSLLIVLQGAWAGQWMSTPDTDPQKTPWLEVHSWCGKIAILFAALSVLWSVACLKQRRDLQLGAAALTILLVLEAYLGGLIVDDGKDSMAAVHVPLAMALTALAVWLPLRALRRRRDARTVDAEAARAERVD